MDAHELAMTLGAELRGHSAESAAVAIESYCSGRSARMAQRDSGVPERIIERWVEQLGLKRTKAETAKIKSAALAAGRATSSEIRRTLGAL